MYGAANPAMLPMVLMSAIPAAAAAPVRNWVGTVQKFGSAAKMAMAVIVMTAIVAAGDPAKRASGMLRPPTRAGTAMCQVLTPRLVASLDQKYRAKAAGRYGMAVMRPFWKTSNLVPYWPSKPEMMVGRKKPSAYRP